MCLGLACGMRVEFMPRFSAADDDIVLANDALIHPTLSGCLNLAVDSWFGFHLSRCYVDDIRRFPGLPAFCADTC